MQRWASWAPKKFGPRYNFSRVFGYFFETEYLYVHYNSFPAELALFTLDLFQVYRIRCSDNGERQEQHCLYDEKDCAKMSNI